MHLRVCVNPKCRHQWTARIEALPVKCPRCQAPYSDETARAARIVIEIIESESALADEIAETVKKWESKRGKR